MRNSGLTGRSAGLVSETLVAPVSKGVLGCRYFEAQYEERLRELKLQYGGVVKQAKPSQPSAAGSGVLAFVESYFVECAGSVQPRR